MQKGESCLSYISLAFEFQNGHHSLELSRVLYDCYILQHTLDKALEVADLLHRHAETDEDSLEAAALQLRCLYQLDPARGMKKLFEVVRNYDGSDLEGDALVLKPRDVFRDIDHSPYLPQVMPPLLHSTMEGILSESLPVAYSMSTNLGLSVVRQCIRIAEVCMFYTVL
jgi:hypothetical protein